MSPVLTTCRRNVKMNRFSVAEGVYVRWGGDCDAICNGDMTQKLVIILLL
jgi:hypothetical protein